MSCFFKYFLASYPLLWLFLAEILNMRTAIFIILSILFCSCASTYTKHKADYQFKSIDGRPDFSNLNFWAAHPWKHDTSDSIPSTLKEKNIADSTVDVFFIYPTSYTDKNMPFGYNAPIDDAKLNMKTDYASILYQASVFNNVGRLFAPRYRQANYYAYFPITKEDTVLALAAFDTAYVDVKAAFEYYLKNYNNGKPFIIASHSQGTTHAKRLMKEFLDGKPLQRKLIAAYLVGMPVELNYFTQIPICNNPNQTGCFCTWRTFEDGYMPDYVAKEKEIAVTNPLTWDATKTTTTRKDNDGSVLKNFNKIKAGVTNANTKNGFIWADHPHFFGSFLLKTKNYHIADYNFYYLSIRNNVKNRVNLFWK